MATEWAGKAEAYDRSFARLCGGTVPFLIDRILANGARGPALDVGTGTGTVAAAMAALGLEVMGTDAEPDMVKFAAPRHPDVRFVTDALPTLSFDDGAYAVTVANFVINHVPEPARAVRELVRVTAPGGLVQMTVWPSTPVSAMNTIWNRVVQESRATPIGGHRLAPEDDFERSTQGVARLLITAGLEAVEARPVSWDFVIPADELWCAVEAGIATIGETYVAQNPETKEAMRSIYDKMTEGSTLVLPSVAILGVGRVPSGTRAERPADPHTQLGGSA